MEFAKIAEAKHFGRPTPWYALILWACWRLYGWVSFTGQAKGRLVEGVSEAPPTRSKVQNLWLKLFGWKRVSVFRVPEEHVRSGYHVGYKPTTDVTATSVCMLVSHSREFGMKIGHEDCVFFAVTRLGFEIPIEFVGVFPTNHPTAKQARSF